MINNAGSGGLGPFMSGDEERLRKIMEVNFFAPTEFIREALPLLSASRSPIIVNVASYEHGVAHADWQRVNGFSEAVVAWIAASEETMH